MASATSILVDVPLFPLAAVLFPDGPMELCVFEPRHVDLVRECAGSGGPFGACLILAGNEDDACMAPAAIGTLAHITDFYTSEQGLLGICIEGRERFRVARVRTRHDGQLRGDLVCWEPEPAQVVTPEYSLLVTILERLVEQMAPPWKTAPRERYDDATWVGFRLAELLPLDPTERQLLLEMLDPLERLSWLRDVIARFQRD